MTILLTILISLFVLVASYFVGHTIVEDCDSLFGTIFLQTTVGLVVVLLSLVVIGLVIYFAYKLALLFPVMI
jgi:hypothetical protein